jgi:putative ATP-dependent endonuclease of OLD family
MRSKLLEISIKNLGCIGSDGLTISLDNILCLVGNNNTGKSTVLRAYELAIGSVKYDINKDRNKLSNQNTEIEISVHIPEGIGNIAEKWKIVDGNLRIVKSRWIWDESGNKIRETYNPNEIDYAADGNAAGLDTVFTSRLPKPFRIGALENPDGELKNLLKLIVDPISEKLKKEFEDTESEISLALEAFNNQALKPVKEEAKKIENYNKQLTKSHNSIFPNLKIDLKIGISDIKFDPIKALVDGSNLNINEFGQIVDWNQQGTGSQRALFWSLLQVRSKLQTINDLKSDNEKKIKGIEGEIKKLEKDRDKATRTETKESKQVLIEEKIKKIEELKKTDFDKTNDENDIALPGYMLLIDEPEIALHPNGIRAASRYLYELAKDRSWQVMLTTHSPLFINPFEDNTTIVRLNRTEGNPSPLTYRSESIKFSDEEKQQLTLLNTFDQNLSEMFFGQHPIIVEGDTEFAAFIKVMEIENEKYPLSVRPIVIRARGKFTILPLIKMLNHFKVDFSVLHDSDYPKNKNGGNNGVWSANKSIHDEIIKCRNDGSKVIHRISISTFELEIFGLNLDKDGNVEQPASKDKPFETYAKISEVIEIKKSIEKILDELSNVGSNEFPFNEKDANYLPQIFKKWVKENGIKDIRYLID